jgi:hypothetical protein
VGQKFLEWNTILFFSLITIGAWSGVGLDIILYLIRCQWRDKNNQKLLQGGIKK